MGEYSKEFREQLMKEARETGNAALVARRHGVKVTRLYSWIQQAKGKKESSKGKGKSVHALEQQLAAKERENEILKELLKKTNQVWLGDSQSPGNSSMNGGGQ